MNILRYFTKQKLFYLRDAANTNSQIGNSAKILSTKFSLCLLSELRVSVLKKDFF